jgi:hypothetical protein
VIVCEVSDPRIIEEIESVRLPHLFLSRLTANLREFAQWSCSFPLGRKKRKMDSTHSDAFSAKAQRAAASTDPRESATSLSPPVVSERRRRLVPRYLIDVPCLLSCPHTGATLRSQLVRISLLGGCLEGAGLPGVGQLCGLQTEWKGMPFSVSGQVVWQAKGRAGVKFSPPDEVMGTLLRRMCTNLRPEPPAPLPC